VRSQGTAGPFDPDADFGVTKISLSS